MPRISFTEGNVPNHERRTGEVRRFVAICDGASLRITFTCDENGGLVVALDELTSGLDARLTVWLNHQIIHQQED